MPVSGSETGRQRPTRRQVTTGAAWAIPVVVLAAPAPASAVSPTCPSATASGVISGGLDLWTITNSGPATWPAGTTITWTVQNRRGSNDTFSVPATTGLTPTTRPATTLADGATVTWSFATTGAVSANSSVSVSLQSTRYTYDSTFVISFSGTSLSFCPSIQVCASDRWITFGAVCASAGLAAAARAAPGPELPDPRRR